MGSKNIRVGSKNRVAARAERPWIGVRHGDWLAAHIHGKPLARNGTLPGRRAARSDKSLKHCLPSHPFFVHFPPPSPPVHLSSPWQLSIACEFRGLLALPSQQTYSPSAAARAQSQLPPRPDRGRTRSGPDSVACGLSGDEIQKGKTQQPAPSCFLSFVCFPFGKAQKGGTKRIVLSASSRGQKSDAALLCDSGRDVGCGRARPVRNARVGHRERRRRNSHHQGRLPRRTACVLAGDHAGGSRRYSRYVARGWAGAVGDVADSVQCSNSCPKTTPSC